MSFMKPVVTDKQQWYMVDGPMGTEYVPADVVGVTVTVTGKTRYATVDEIREIDDCQESEDNDSVRLPVPASLSDYCENKECWNFELIEGYGARMSAPGYMDCTDWSVFDTPEEAEAYLKEYYMDDEEAEDEDTE